ncbi:MAG: GDP-mannose 4,6 dehydratase [Pseudonocardiales bacterium]|nr:MAG: GDP-mannose 4,6 dehydratase [Pseudonocardiales bacterium]
MPRSLVTGVTGQDGWYLSELLLEQDHAVFGLITDGDLAPVPAGVEPLPGNLGDAASLAAAVDAARPDEIYNLAAISSVVESWRDPARVADINGVGVVRLLDAAAARAQRTGEPVKIVQASSAEIFGDCPPPQDEGTVIRPSTPYGAAKAFAHHAVGVYRSTGLAASCAILYNHESPRRPSHFVTRKITSAAARISCGSTEPLVLGNLDVRRDWGHARDYMQAMTMIARHGEAADFIIASGVSRSVEEFVVAAFGYVGIADWSRHVRIDPALVRPGEQFDKCGDPTRAQRELGWRAETTFDDLVAAMVDADLAGLRDGNPRGTR